MASAQLNGTLTDDGGLVCDTRFEWGTTPAMGNFTVWDTPYITGDTFSATIIIPGGVVTIYFRAIARNAVGTVTGATLSFTTPGQPPDVITLPATSIGETDAQLNGYIQNDRGGGCSTWFEFGGSAGYGNETVKVSGAVTGSTFSSQAYPLSGGHSFHYRAVARNRFGTGYGADVTFSTPSGRGSMSNFPPALIYLQEKDKEG